MTKESENVTPDNAEMPNFEAQNVPFALKFVVFTLAIVIAGMMLVIVAGLISDDFKASVKAFMAGDKVAEKQLTPFAEAVPDASFAAGKGSGVDQSYEGFTAFLPVADFSIQHVSFKGDMILLHYEAQGMDYLAVINRVSQHVQIIAIASGTDRKQEAQQTS